MKNKRNPDVLHVGFSKCASTFLQSFFSAHPSIFLVDQSHYFAPISIGYYDRGAEWYQCLYDTAKSDHTTLESDEHILMPLFHPVLHSAATTLDSLELITKRIRKTNPDAKIIIGVRNQADLLVSRYSEYMICGGTLGFDKFVEEQIQCSVDGRCYYENYYFEIVKHIESIFGASNVFVFCQEQLRLSEPQVLQKLCDFIGVSYQETGPRNMVSQRVGLSSLGLKLMRSFNTLVVVQCKMNHRDPVVRLPKIVYKSTVRAIRYLDYRLPNAVKGDKITILSPMARNRILSLFEKDNRRLSEYLNIDLSQHGYYTTRY
ncbi:MAG: sulfotransferase domain-containing protein [Chloroflexota bacterium]|nr:sulfotransferase domain-containing protein [Chloroflexota bacterium]